MTDLNELDVNELINRLKTTNRLLSLSEPESQVFDFNTTRKQKIENLIREKGGEVHETRAYRPDPTLPIPQTLADQLKEDEMRGGAHDGGKKRKSRKRKSHKKQQKSHKKRRTQKRHKKSKKHRRLRKTRR